ncbi:MAG TPA: alkyl sulfatase dimerization domain-containing protein [Acidimicrobiia bacterium]
MTDLLALAERVWQGEERYHPFRGAGTSCEVAEGIAFVPGFSNVAAVSTDDGLVLVDTGTIHLADVMHDAVRQWSQRPLHTAVFTHGHIDHVFGVDRYEADNDAAGAPRPAVIAHEAVPARFDRYRATAGYNGIINQRQFSLPSMHWPVDFRYPDATYRDHLDLDVGGRRLELRHDRGETDDHTWVWLPGDRVLCTGDLFIWASPNCGNPQKVQRYPKDWAVALRTMASLHAETLLPGHGLPIVGRERVRQALEDTAELLEVLHDRTLEMMNAGADLDEIVHTVRAPERLLERPYLRPVYDEPEFVVRNVWRLYGGWYDGNPARLKPPRDTAVAAEVAGLAGGPATLAARARAVADSGDLRLAAQLAEWALEAAPDDPGVRDVAREVYARRVEAEASTMAKGIFRWAAGRGSDDASEEEASDRGAGTLRRSEPTSGDES